MADTLRGSEADRLPWLIDDVKRPRQSSGWVVAFVAASAVAIIAAVSFWLGMNGAVMPQQRIQAQPEARIDLPSSGTAIEAPVQPAMPDVEPAPVPPPVAIPAQEDVRMEAPPIRRVARKAAVVHRSHHAKAKVASSKKTSSSDGRELKYLNPWKSKDASGRMVRVGAYGSLEKGKDAWARLAALSPAIKKLPAVVTDIPSPTGRTLYWLQIGTTSQAHSEVLCQRMRAMGQRCVVVDLAGARKDSGNERQPAGL